MYSIQKNEILEFSEDTLQVVRKEYDLDTPGSMDQAVDILDLWVKKQKHFTQKDFPRDFLERQIIFCKGSLERTKRRLDRNCTLKRLVPELYKPIDLKIDYEDSNILIDAVLPKLTKDYCRVYLLRNIGKRFNNGFTNYFRFLILLAEYIVKHDYNKGVIIVVDYTNTNLFELMKALDISEFRQAMKVMIESYTMRFKGIHVITPSKAVSTLITIFKTILSGKLAKRIHVHKNYESLQKVISKDILPVELGGNERSVVELHERWVDILCSDKNQEYFREIRKATTDEQFREMDKLNEEYIGMPGSLKTLTLD